MHPPSPYTLTSLILLIGLLSSCRPNIDDEAVEVDENSHRERVLSVVTAAATDSVRAALTRLSSHSHLRDLRIEQLDPDGKVVAFRQQIGRHDPTSRPQMLSQVDSSGSFDFGWFDRIVGRQVQPISTPDQASAFIPEEPAYLSPRHFQDFTYRLLPDTSIGGEIVRVAEIRVRPGRESAQQLKFARYLISEEDHSPVEVSIERGGDAVVFNQESVVFISMQRLEDGTLIPDSSSVETRLHVPVAGRYAFRVLGAFSEFARAIPD